jgi:nucleoside-diphosphate-sugar epimerase
MTHDHSRILVTGAKGFLGSHIVRLGRGMGLDIVAAHRGLKEEVSVHLDVCSADSVLTALRDASPSIIIHCAAYGLNYAQQDLWQALAVNVDGTLVLLETAKRCGVRRFVHVGTCFEYGSYDVPIREDFALKPTGIYGATKAAASVLMQERARALDMELLIVRPFSIWGPGDAPYHLIPQVIAACVNHVPLDLSPCQVVRDYMYVEEVADRILRLAMLDGRADQQRVVNVGSGQGRLLRTFISELAKELGGERLMNFGAIPYRPTEMQALVADTSRLKATVPEHLTVPLRRGVLGMTQSLK